MKSGFHEEFSQTLLKFFDFCSENFGNLIIQQILSFEREHRCPFALVLPK
jgi:hypothetical protein